MRSVRRRRLQRKTDYKSRFGLLKSGKARIVVRRTNRFVLGQIVTSDVAQDSVVGSFNSKELLDKGWAKDAEGSLKSLPACYLTGWFTGKLALENKISEAVLDVGMSRMVHKSRIFAFLKGAVDAGLVISHSDESLPSLDEIGKDERLKSVMGAVKK